MPDSVRAVLLIVGAAVAFVAVALGVQHGVPLLTAALPATAAMMALAFLLIRPGEVARERKAKGLCQRCGYDPRGNVSGVCPECGDAVTSPPGALRDA